MLTCCRGTVWKYIQRRRKAGLMRLEGAQMVVETTVDRLAGGTDLLLCRHDA